MKIYKPTYGISAYYFLANFFLMAIPMFIVLGFVLAFEGHGGFWYAPIAFLISIPVAGITFFVLILLINLVAKAITKNKVLVEEHKIYYQGKHLFLDQIQYITLFLPELNRYSRSEPQLLSLWISDKESLVIARPSILLIADLKKRCPKAKFSVEDPMNFLRTSFFIGLGITALVFVISIFTAMG